MTKKEFYELLEEYSSTDYLLINNKKICREENINDDFFDWTCDVWDDDDVGDITVSKVIEIDDYLYEDDHYIYKTDYVSVLAGIDYEEVIEKRSKY